MGTTNLKLNHPRLQGEGFQPSAKGTLTGGEVLGRMLQLSQIEFMLGMGGFQLLPFCDAIACDDKKSFRHILVNDERSGALQLTGLVCFTILHQMAGHLLQTGAMPPLDTVTYKMLIRNLATDDKYT